MTKISEKLSKICCFAVWVHGFFCLFVCHNRYNWNISIFTLDSPCIASTFLDTNPILWQNSCVFGENAEIAENVLQVAFGNARM